MPSITPFDPKVVLMSLLRDHWDDPAVTDEFEDEWSDMFVGYEWGGFEWVIDDHFEVGWIHTGWFDRNSENPQVSIILDNLDPQSPTGFDAVGPDGSKMSQLSNRAHIDTWVQNDRDISGGINPKKYAWQLAARVRLIVLDHADIDGDHPWQHLGASEIRSPEEPEDTPIGGRHRVTVGFSDQQRT